jgi:glycine dehydrogenase
MLAIRAEIEEVSSGEISLTESPLRRAPHTADDLVEEWSRPYSRVRGVFPGIGQPGSGDTADKYWPPVNRIDAAYGDRNLVCTCPDMAAAT